MIQLHRISRTHPIISSSPSVDISASTRSKRRVDNAQLIDGIPALEDVDFD